MRFQKLRFWVSKSQLPIHHYLHKYDLRLVFWQKTHEVIVTVFGNYAHLRWWPMGLLLLGSRHKFFFQSSIDFGPIHLTLRDGQYLKCVIWKKFLFFSRIQWKLVKLQLSMCTKTSTSFIEFEIRLLRGDEFGLWKVGRYVPEICKPFIH